MSESIQVINRWISGVNFFVGRLFPTVGVLTSQAAIVTQVGSSSVSILNNEGTAVTVVEGVELNAPTLAVFAKVGGWINTLARAAGVAIPGVGMVALGMTAISAVAAAAANQTFSELVTDPDFWRELAEGDVETYLQENYGVGFAEVLTAMFEAITTGQMNLNPVGPAARMDPAQRLPRNRDPLILDLDGDGLETVGTDAGILFDHDGDGLKTGTGWVKADDGFLVLDRNGNGVIDTGAELFGDATLLYAGGTAADGFAALAQEDSNLDGKVDSSDARWNQLRIWQDANQDGVSQATELKTLAALDIASIDVAATAHSQMLANGNQVADLGTYTKTDGSGGTLGETSRLADVNLGVDTFQREFTDSIPLTEAAKTLPDMQGSGLVRDLRQAASQSGSVASLLAQYAAAPTRAAQLVLPDLLLRMGMGAKNHGHVERRSVA